MPEFLVAAVLIGVPVIVLGYILKRYKLVEVIAGYDEKKVVDKDGLANWVGGNLIWLGFISILLGVIPFFVRLSVIHMMIGYTAIMLFLLLRTITGTKKFEKKEI